MTTRSNIIARIGDRIQFITGTSSEAFAPDRPLIGQSRGQAHVDMLDIAEIENDIEDEFALSIGALDSMPVDWSIDSIADLIEARNA